MPGRMQRKGSLCTFGGNIKQYSYQENSIQVPQEIKYRSSNPNSGYTSIFKGYQIIISRYLYSHIQSSITYNSQGIKTTLLSMDKLIKNILYIHTYTKWILFSLNKEGAWIGWLSWLEHRPKSCGFLFWVRVSTGGNCCNFSLCCCLCYVSLLPFLFL